MVSHTHTHTFAPPVFLPDTISLRLLVHSEHVLGCVQMTSQIRIFHTHQLTGFFSYIVIFKYSSNSNLSHLFFVTTTLGVTLFINNPLHALLCMIVMVEFEFKRLF